MTEKTVIERDNAALEAAIKTRDEALAQAQKWLAKGRAGEAVPCTTVAEKMQRVISAMVKDESEYGPYRHSPRNPSGYPILGA
jgi:hypothetical protein